MPSNAVRSDEVEVNAGDWLDSESRLMRVLLELVATLPPDHRVDIASAFYRQLGDDTEDIAPWRRRWRKELGKASHELDAGRIEAALRAKRAARAG